MISDPRSNAMATKMKPIYPDADTYMDLIQRFPLHGDDERCAYRANWIVCSVLLAMMDLVITLYPSLQN